LLNKCPEVSVQEDGNHNSSVHVHEAEIDIKSNISCATVRERIVAVAGKETELQLWDIDSQKRTWMAKNVRPLALESELTFPHSSLVLFSLSLSL
jgi:hypothetical protein